MNNKTDRNTNVKVKESDINGDYYWPVDYWWMHEEWLLLKAIIIEANEWTMKDNDEWRRRTTDANDDEEIDYSAKDLEGRSWWWKWKKYYWFE